MVQGRMRRGLLDGGGDRNVEERPSEDLGCFLIMYSTLWRIGSSSSWFTIMVAVQGWMWFRG